MNTSTVRALISATLTAAAMALAPAAHAGSARPFTLGRTEAITRALGDLHGELPAPRLVAAGARDGWAQYKLAPTRGPSVEISCAGKPECVRDDGKPAGARLDRNPQQFDDAVVGRLHHLDLRPRVFREVVRQPVLKRRSLAVGDFEPGGGQLGGKVAHRAPHQHELLAMIAAAARPSVGFDHQDGCRAGISVGQWADGEGQLVAEDQHVAARTRDRP